MPLKIYQVDAFAKEPFSGNPAAVCPLQEWPDDGLMQKIAMENNLSETAFYVKENGRYRIRWFTPATEVALCGHATLATAYVLFNHENHEDDVIRFDSRSGELTVTRHGDILTLNFPADPPEPVALTAGLADCFDKKPVAAFKGKTDYMIVFEDEEDIRHLAPRFDRIAAFGGRAVMVTAKGTEADFVSRFFAPQTGVPEDPVTGSAHTTLTPYWSRQLGKTEMTAVQLSPRKGYLQCKYLGDRVEISGRGRLFMTGEIVV